MTQFSSENKVDVQQHTNSDANIGPQLNKKKNTVNNENAKKRLFQEVRTECTYGCLENGDKLICTLCTDIITAETCHVDRHFASKDKDVSEMANKDKQISFHYILEYDG